MNKGLKLVLLISFNSHLFLKRNTDLMNKGLKLFRGIQHTFVVP